MVPFADMFNHKHPQKTNWTYYNSKRGFLVQATDDIAQGEEVFVGYNDKSSMFQLFYGYGFLQESRNND